MLLTQRWLQLTTSAVTLIRDVVTAALAGSLEFLSAPVGCSMSLFVSFAVGVGLAVEGPLRPVQDWFGDLSDCLPLKHIDIFRLVREFVLDFSQFLRG